jgi:beta-lactamase regulating signal transducer with metallopeptidase domain
MNFVQSLFQHPLVSALGWALLHSLWQGALLMLLLGVGLFALRRRSANVRYLLSCAALVAMVVCPLLTVTLPRSETPAPIRPYISEDAPPSLFSTMDYTGATLVVDERSVTLPAKLEPLFPMIVAFWLVGVCVLTVRLLMGCLLVRRLARENRTRRLDAFRYVAASLSLRMGMTHIPLLLESARVEVPTVFGWLRAVILIPPSALAGLSPQALEALLAHELAHIRRHDYLVNLIQAILETLLFYHPATWWISARIRIEREHCCDDLAVRVLGNQALYVHALATMESLRSTPPTTALAGNGGSLIVRVRRLLDLPHGNPHPLPPAGLALLSLCTLCGLVTLGHYAPARQPVERKMSAGPERIEWQPSLIKEPVLVPSRPVSARQTIALSSDSVLAVATQRAVLTASPRGRSENIASPHPPAPVPSPPPAPWGPPDYGLPRFSHPEIVSDTRRVVLDEAKVEEEDRGDDEWEGGQKMRLVSGPDKKQMVVPAVLQNGSKWGLTQKFSVPKPFLVNANVNNTVNANFNNNVNLRMEVRAQVEQGVRGIESAVKALQINIDTAHCEAEERKNRGEDNSGFEHSLRAMEQVLKQMHKELEKARRKADEEADRILKQILDKEQAQREREKRSEQDKRQAQHDKEQTRRDRENARREQEQRDKEHWKRKAGDWQRKFPRSQDFEGEKWMLEGFVGPK